MRQFIKYVISMIYFPLITLSFYLTFNTSLPYHSLWYIASDVFFLLFLILSIVNTDDLQFTITRPKLHKKVFHEAGKYYIFYNSTQSKYILYRDWIVFREEIYTMSGSEIEDTRNNETPQIRLSKKIKERLDNIYSERLIDIKRKDLINKWDGYTSDQSRRDDKIGKLI